MGDRFFLSLAGAAAGLINGLFGAGGGMVLVPMLGKKAGISEQERFPASVAIIAPVCVVSLLLSGSRNNTFLQVLPYLLGGAVGGVAAGLWGKRIPTVWLHRMLGALILWGGIRYLC
ncbi:MAG: TSUP family transporter [Oscillospiraceae bacterium]|nr:TSUP family transporter [Oscillospiraceae bacterium]